MKRLKCKGTSLGSILLIVVTGSAASAQSVTSNQLAQSTGQSPTASQAPAPAAILVPKDFKLPTLVETADFKIVPLGPALAKIDFVAYMSSIKHLQETFTRSTAWPHEGISDADTMRDMEAEEARFRNRTSFAYAVLTPDGSRERGCVYISPSDVDGYDAVVRLWVTKPEYDAGFDAQLYQWVTRWIQKGWPFSNVAYPGRSIELGSWDASVAARKARTTAPD